MFRIDPPAAGATQGQPSPSASDLSSRAGSYMGQQVTVKDVGSSILSDSAEEITFALADEVEVKDIEERKIEVELRPEAMSTAQIEAYLEDTNKQQTPEDMAALAKLMLSGQASPRSAARQGSGDVTGQFLLLQYAARKGEEQGASLAHLEAIYDAIAELEIESGDHIHADLNTIDTARTAGGASDIARFQGTYRDVILGERTLAQTLITLLARFGDADFSAGLSKLVQALGTDLAATRPSIDPVRLQTLLQDLYNLEVTATVLESARALAQTLSTKHGVPDMDAVKAMSELVATTAEKWIAATRFTSLAERFAGPGTGAQIAFLTVSKTMVRELPVKVFVDLDSRQAILKALQEALDGAIDREDEQA